MEQNLTAIISLLIIFSSVIAIVLLPKRTARANHEPALQKTGDLADADVLSVEQLQETDNGIVIMSVRLRVFPANDEPYETRTDAKIWRVDIPHLQPGRKIRVLIDPKNREDVAVDLDLSVLA